MATKRNQKNRDRRKRRKAENLASANSCTFASEWTKFTPYHWGMTINGMRLDYWPSTRKAMWQGKVYSQIVDMDQFIEEICGGM